MLLLIDAGNTRIKWALVNSIQTPKLGEWGQQGSLSHQEFINAEPPWYPFDVQRVIVSNVAGHALRNQLARSFLLPDSAVEWFASQPTLAGLKNSYRNPTQLGSDRFASAIAARALFPQQALIIATCGTALTIDAVTAQGDFIGGMIAPGLKLMAQSLAQNTAQLPSTPENTTITSHFANHTEAAIISGCLAAQAGAIKYAIHEFANTTNLANTTSATTYPLCILSGGGAKYVMPSLDLSTKWPNKLSFQFVDNLVLIGLQVISTC